MRGGGARSGACKFDEFVLIGGKATAAGMLGDGDGMSGGDGL